MDVQAITIYMIFGGDTLLALIIGAAWLHHLWAHRERAARATIHDNLDRLGRLQSVQYAVTCAFGLIAGVAFFFGWVADYFRP